MDSTPIYDRVQSDLGIRPLDQVREPWNFAERDASIRRSLTEGPSFSPSPDWLQGVRSDR